MKKFKRLNFLLKRIKTTFLIVFAIALTYQDTYAQLAARVYKDDCYQNSSQNMWAYASYKKSQLSFGNDRISSVNILNSNYFVRLFEHDNFLGEYRDIYSDMKDLSTIDFEDETSSIKVYQSWNTLPTSSEAKISANILNGAGFLPTSQRTFNLPRNQVDNYRRIHNQSLARNDAGNRIVISGCKANSVASGCRGKSYLFLFDNSGNFIDKFEPKRYYGNTGGYTHPVHSQFIGNNFVAAITEMTTDNNPIKKTRLSFHTISGDDLRETPGQGSFTVDDHIGAIAYANVDGNTYIIGQSFDGKRLHVWKSNGINKINGFYSILSNVDPSGRFDSRASLDENWAPYNSFWLGQFKEDGRVVLFATHAKSFPLQQNFADVYEVRNLTGGYMRFVKIHKKKRNGPDAYRPYFLQGTIPVDKNGGASTEIHAFPQDFYTFWGSTLKADYFTLEYYQKNCNNLQSEEDPEAEKSLDVSEADILQARQSEIISSENQEFEIKISPNPVGVTDGILTLEFLQIPSNVENIKTYLFDLRGKLVKEYEIDTQQFYDMHQLDVFDLAKGMYVLKAYTDGGVEATAKIIKM